MALVFFCISRKLLDLRNPIFIIKKGLLPLFAVTASDIHIKKAMIKFITECSLASRGTKKNTFCKMKHAISTDSLRSSDCGFVTFKRLQCTIEVSPASFLVSRCEI